MAFQSFFQMAFKGPSIAVILLITYHTGCIWFSTAQTLGPRVRIPTLMYDACKSLVIGRFPVEAVLPTYVKGLILSEFNSESPNPYHYWSGSRLNKLVTLNLDRQIIKLVMEMNSRSTVTLTVANLFTQLFFSIKYSPYRKKNIWNKNHKFDLMSRANPLCGEVSIRKFINFDSNFTKRREVFTPTETEIKFNQQHLM
jgi:hypothetical protein